jgi:hypothetical protein
MGLLFSRRVGSEPYYLCFEKAFEKISSKEALVAVRNCCSHAAQFNSKQCKRR